MAEDNEDQEISRDGSLVRVVRRDSMILRGIAEGRRERREDKNSLRHRIGLFLESYPMELLGVILIAADIICIVIELMIDDKMMCFGWEDEGYRGGKVSHEADHTAAHGLHVEAHAPHRLLGGGGHHYEDWKCNGGEAHVVHHNVHIASISILTYFMVELILKLVVDPKEFCLNTWHALDLTIVFISWLVDIFIQSITTHLHEQGEILAVMAVTQFVRFWRVVRIVHALFEEYQIEHKYIHDLEVQVKALTSHCKESGLKIPEDLKEENADLLERQQSRLVSNSCCPCFDSSRSGNRLVAPDEGSSSNSDHE